MTNQLVKITWHDAHSTGSTWQGVSEIDENPCVVVSVGHLLDVPKSGHIVIAQSLIPDPDEASVDHVLAIPTKMIVRIDRLKSHGLLPIEPDQ